jgi:hypothetical protein
MKSSLGGFESQAEKASKKTSMFSDALSTASGMLMRDFVQSASKAVIGGMELAAEFQSLNSSFNAMKTNLGATELSLEKLQNATKNTVAKVDLLASANKAMSLGLPTENLDDLFASAMKLGRVMGISTKDAIDSLTTGIGRQSAMILDNLGVTFKAEDAYIWYANSLGKTTSELTESEKKLGWQAYAMEQVTEKAEDLGDVQDDLITSQEQMSATMTNLNTDVGNILGPLGAYKDVINMVSPVITGIAMQAIPAWIAAHGGLKASLVALSASFKTLTTSAVGAWAAVLGPVGIAFLGNELKKWIQTTYLDPMAREHAAETGFPPDLVDRMKELVPSGIPWKQEGGIFRSPSIIGVGEAGPEAVVPLGRDLPMGLVVHNHFNITVDEWTDLNKVKEAAKQGAAEGLGEAYQSRGGF